MQGASRESLAAVRAYLEERSADTDGAGLAEVANGVRAVVRLLDREGTLRRTLGDPTLDSAAKEQLLDGLIGTQVPVGSLGLVKKAVSLRWSSPRDLVDALEIVGATATFLGAEKAGELDRVTDELFRFGRIVTGDPALRAVLTDHALADDRKQALLDGLLEGKASAATRGVLETLVLAPRGATFEDGLASYLDLAAGVRRRSLATVTSAVPLDAAQQQRLAASLTQQLGREVQLQVEVDPSVLGGVLVRIGDEVIDGSTRHRLAQARRAAS